MFSQTVEYALRAVMHLASLPAGSALSSEGIAARTLVPKGYLSKIMRDLVLAQIVTSQRGPNGGFTLARPPSAISILDIMGAVDPIQRIRHCPLGNPAHVNLCPLHRRLDDALATMEREFSVTKLSELLETVPRGVDASAPRCRALVTPTVSKRGARKG